MIVAVAVRPFDVVAVMVAVPLATAVTTPADDTIAIAVSEEDHVTVRSVALEGCTLALRLRVKPMFTVAVLGDTVTLSG